MKEREEIREESKTRKAGKKRRQTVNEKTENTKEGVVKRQEKG